MPHDLRDDYEIREDTVTKSYRLPIEKGTIEVSVIGPAGSSAQMYDRTELVTRLRKMLVDYLNEHYPQWIDDIDMISEQVTHVTSRTLYIIRLRKE